MDASGLSEPTPARHRVNPGRNLPLAIGVAAILLAWIVGSLLWWNWGFIIFLIACVVAGSYEVVGALSKLRIHAVFAPIAIGGPLTIVGAYLVASYKDQWSGIATVLGGLSVMVVLTLILRLRGPVNGYVKDVAGSVFVIGYVPLLLSMLTLLITQPDGHLRVMLYFLLVAAGDTGAYATGLFFGKHKMAPHISPAKTWEGFAGGLALGAIVGGLLAPVMIHATWWAGAIIGLLLAVTGATGDMVESMIKRDAKIKDMGTILPGHGGAMDRLDSLLLAAPMAWISMLLLV